jgi:hypothetical protein
MKAASVLGFVGFWGAMIGVGYSLQKGSFLVLVIYLAVALYWTLETKKDPDYIEKLPPFIQGVAAFAVSTFVLLCVVFGIAAFFLLVLSSSR